MLERNVRQPGLVTFEEELAATEGLQDPFRVDVEDLASLGVEDGDALPGFRVEKELNTRILVGRVELDDDAHRFEGAAGLLRSCCRQGERGHGHCHEKRCNHESLHVDPSSERRAMRSAGNSGLDGVLLLQRPCHPFVPATRQRTPGVRHGGADPRKILRDTRTPRAHAIRMCAGRLLSLRGGSCYFFFLLAVLLLAGSTAIASASVYVMSTTSPTDTRSRLLGFLTLMGLPSPCGVRSVTVPAALSIAAMVART